MKLLIITQAVDTEDPVLGFFVRWIEEFSKHTERTEVICLREGEHDSLPKNVRIHSLGKEHPPRTVFNFWRRALYAFRFLSLAWRLRHEYDAVFVHMNQIYVILGGLFWKITHRRVGFWYVHRAKTFSLWAAEKFADVVFTSRKESFTLATNKSVCLNHGIPIETSVRPLQYDKEYDPRALLCVGRLTPIKDQKTIIRACGILARKNTAFSCTFIGCAVTAGDGIYQSELRDLVAEEGIADKVIFMGSIRQSELPPFYWQSGIHINMCPTGGLDKVVIEGMLGGAIPIIVNEAFRDALGIYADRLISREGDAVELARHVESLFEADDREEIRIYLEKRARERFDLSVLVKRIINWYETSR